MYRFAVERVPDIGPWLSGLSVRNIQPRLNLLLKLANHHDLEEDTFYSQIVTPSAKTITQEIVGGETFNADHFLGTVERALSDRLELDSRDLGRMLTAIERFPNKTLEELRTFCKPASPTPPASSTVSQQATATNPPAGQTITGITPISSGDRPTAKPKLSGVSITVTGNSQSEPAPVAQQSSESDSGQQPEASSNGRVMDLVQTLLVQAGLGTCYEAAPGMPLGYVMGFPKDGPLDLKEQAQSRQAAWWVLAMASGQFDQETCRAGLEETSVWRGLILEESNAQTLGGLELEIQHNIGGQGEFLSIPWLLNTDNAIAGACIALLSLIRGTRS